jgi:catechol 2,3-dioxygenase-like lactoylglutathione lyase family enzyme
MKRVIPALPVRDIGRSTEFYCEKLGFALGHREDGFAIFRRDAAEIHIWAAADESWRTRGELVPVVSGAESFIAGTASCRLEAEDVDELYKAYQAQGILPADAQLIDQWWGSREFHLVDPDNNLITFFEPR